MSKKNYSDEELLSYIMGDCSLEFFNEIESKLGGDPLLKADILELKGLYRGIKNLNLDVSEAEEKNVFWGRGRAFLLAVCAVVFGFFVMDGNDFFLQNGGEGQVIKGLGEKEKVQSFSWDDSHLAFLM